MSIDPRAVFAYLKMSTEYGFEPPRTLRISGDTYSILRPTEQPFDHPTKMVHREQHSGRNEHVLVGSRVVQPRDG